MNIQLPNTALTAPAPGSLAIGTRVLVVEVADRYPPVRPRSRPSTHRQYVGRGPLRIRKVSGGANRINIDNISATSGGGGGSSSVHLTMGNPSGAVTDTSFPANYLMEKAQYVMSYHRDNGTPNWVSWHLATSWLGSTPRQDDFRADTTLPAGWYQVGASSYSGGLRPRPYVPSGDRTATVADNSSTFLMTNMIPQAPDNTRRRGESRNLLPNACRPG